MVGRTYAALVRRGERNGNSAFGILIERHLHRHRFALWHSVGGLFEVDGDRGHIIYRDNLVRALAAAIVVDNIHHRLIRGPFAYSGGQPAEGEFDRLVVVVLIVIGGFEVNRLLGVAAIEDDAVRNAVVVRGSAVLVSCCYGHLHSSFRIGIQDHFDCDGVALDDTVGILLEADRYRHVFVVGHVYQYVADGYTVILRVGTRGSVSDRAVLVIVPAVLRRRYRDGLGRVPVARSEGQICRIGCDVGVGRVVDRDGDVVGGFAVQDHGVGVGVAFIYVQRCVGDRHSHGVVVCDRHRRLVLAPG